MTVYVDLASMGMRTVRLDDETEKVLEQLMRETGLSASAALKRGIWALHSEVARQSRQAPYEVYRRLALRPGGYAIAPSSETRQGMLESVRKKHRR